ncbi:MAG: motility associated factor glycosyltransferase family protein [Chlamydiia bacterium]|nr:motility associated factor glycosyltransferase family protein [Chlamydiia bacterium]
MSEKNSVNSPFHKNLEIWSHFYPKEAVMLPYHEAEGYELDKNGLKGPKGHYITADPKAWFKSIPFQEERVLVVYGVGWGELFDPIKKWLDQNEERRVFFFEEDPNVLVRFFETKQATKVLSHPQVEVHLLQSLSEKDPALEKFYWSNVLMNTAFICHPAYKAWYPKRYKDFERALRFQMEMKNALVEEYVKYGVSFFRNFYFNILKLPKSKPADQLWGKFKKVPAIICGAGPSLKKQLKLLEGIKDKALLIAGGSSLNALSHGGVLPHFSTALDPNQEQAKRIETNKAQHLPFFYRTRTHIQAMDLIKGPKLYVVGSGGFDVSDYFEERLGLNPEFIDEGHNVINFLCEIVTRLGCDPVIFVGLDLAYTDMQCYSEGVIKDVKLSSETLPKTAIKHQKANGEEILTEWKWLGEAKWLQKYAEEHPKTKFINATEGGLGLDGVEEMSLKSAIKKYLKKPYRLDMRLHRAIDQAKFKKVTPQKVRKLLEELLSSLENCIEILELIRNDADKRIKKNPLAPPDAKVPLKEMELMDEVGYQYVLDIFNHVWAAIQNNELRQLRLNRDKLSKKEIEKKKLTLQNERIDFVLKTARVNTEIIRLALKN